MSKLSASAVALAAFFLLDAAWLTLVAGPLFKAEIGPMLRAAPYLGAAAVFYLIYGAGMAMLVVGPSLREGSLPSAAARGAMLGLTAYATFDLTNLAILSGWTLRISLIDMAWGTVATALACVAGCFAGQKMSGTRA